MKRDHARQVRRDRVVLGVLGVILTALAVLLVLLHTGVVSGVAPGAALAGLVIDRSGASSAYLVSLAAGTLAAVVAQLLPRQRNRVADARDVLRRQ